MKRIKQINYLKDNHLNIWIRTRQQIFDDLSNSRAMFCVCGKLMSAFHEERCPQFNKQVDDETLKTLSYLLPTD